MKTIGIKYVFFLLCLKPKVAGGKIFAIKTNTNHIFGCMALFGYAFGVQAALKI